MAIFTNFYSKFADLKLNSQNKLVKTLVKLILNSAYGYMGLRMDPIDSKIKVAEDNIEPDPTTSYEISNRVKIVHSELVSEDTAYMASSSVVIAAIIAAEARMYMLPFRLSKVTAYTDTDSIVTVTRLPIEGMIIHPKDMEHLNLKGQ